jgi:predicted outer membrane repeat protein
MVAPMTSAKMRLFCVLGLLMPLACGGSNNDEGSNADTETGGDGDGDPTGDGDGDDPTGDGDGDGDDPGDGDGDDPTGDGDGDDPTGDGDGDDPTGDGDGDGDDPTGDGDGDDPTGDGDGDGDFDFDCSEGLDPVIVTLPNNASARYPTIAAGVFASPNGSLVQICPGTYHETVTVEHNITIQGAGPALTIWEPTNAGALMIMSPAVIRDITFTGGKGMNPSGYNVTCGGAMAFENVSSYEATLENLVFEGNTASYGGALCIDGGSNASFRPTVTIVGCTFIDNVATQTGGAIHAYGRFHISDSNISDNTAASGGGLNVNYGCTDVDSCTITNTIVKRNTATNPAQHQGGGGLRLGSYTNGQSKLTVVDSDFGFGAQEENLPDDVRTALESYGFYGNGVSFTCNGTCTAP